MSGIDIILAALILFGLIRGFMKGFFVEVASLAALFAGIYGAIHFSNYASDFLQSKVDWDDKVINITAFVITFVIIVFAIAFAGKALTKLADFAALGIINKLLGGVFGGLKIALILSVLLFVFDKMNKTIPFTDEKILNESILFQPVKTLAPSIFPNILNPNDDSTIEDETPETESEYI